MTEQLIAAMIEYYSSDPKRVQHFMKVHNFSKTIGVLEGLDSETLYVLETAAVVHDIGIKVCEEKYGQCGGKLQEQEGPVVAAQLLKRLGYAQSVIDRVTYLVGHHHTYNTIDGLDYQILVEADFLVNLYEDSLPKAAAIKTCETIFKTKTGRKFCTDMFMQ